MFRVSRWQSHAGLQIAADNARVVVDDKDDGQPAAHRRLQFHGIETKGTVPVDTHYGHLGAGQFGADGEWHPTPMQPLEPELRRLAGV